MNRILYTLLLMFAVVSSLSAQPFDRVVRRNLWNDGDNIAAIRQDSLTFSVASIDGSHEFGDYRTLSQSKSQYSVGLNAQTITHLDKFSMKGSFIFKDTEAKEMTGSMFMDSGFFPIDVYEFTPGHKTFQHYGMEGGISVDLNDIIRIGALLDFNARNAAKRKDLRYSAYRLDMKFSPSVMIVGDDFGAGMSLVMKRNTETISAAQIGSAENAPFAFFDEGLSIGNYQVWTGNGTHLKESGVSGLPVQQNLYGGAIQFSTYNVYADIYGGWLKGKVGEKQTIWYRYSGPEMIMRLSYRDEGSTIRGKFGWNRMDNRESVQDKVTEGGLSIVKEYEGNTVFQTNSLQSSVEYEYMTNSWDVSVKGSFKNLQRMATPMYPYVITRDLKQIEISAIGHYRINSLEFGLSGSYFNGWASDTARSVSSDSGMTSAPYRMDEIYDNICKIETNPAISAALSIDWNFIGKIYLNASFSGSYGLNFVESNSYRIYSLCGLSYVF